MVADDLVDGEKWVVYGVVVFDSMSVERL